MQRFWRRMYLWQLDLTIKLEISHPGQKCLSNEYSFDLSRPDYAG